MERSAVYEDVVSDVRGELLARVDAAVAAGVAPDRLVIDPGPGFAKTAAHDLALVRALPALVELGLPVLLGASRKRFLGHLISDDPAILRPPHERDAATLATSTLAARTGVWGVRVHDVTSTVDALRVVAAVI